MRAEIVNSPICDEKIKDTVGQKLVMMLSSVMGYVPHGCTGGVQV